MKIKICEGNKAIIENELKKVNGRKTAHTYTTYEEVKKVSDKALKHILNYIFKKELPLIDVYSLSGERVPKSYKYSRDGTEIKIEFNKKADAFLTSIKPEKIYDKGGYNQIYISPVLTEVIKTRMLKNVGTF